MGVGTEGVELISSWRNRSLEGEFVGGGAGVSSTAEE